MRLPIFFDRVFDKSQLKQLLRWVFQNYGAEIALEFSERLKNLGFRMSTKAGFSIGIESLLIPKEKRWSARLTEMKAKKKRNIRKIGSYHHS
jgi:DNA-directed RNA polymerase subunit beta'